MFGVVSQFALLAALQSFNSWIVLTADINTTLQIQYEPVSVHVAANAPLFHSCCWADACEEPCPIPPAAIETSPIYMTGDGAVGFPLVLVKVRICTFLLLFIEVMSPDEVKVVAPLMVRACSKKRLCLININLSFGHSKHCTFLYYLNWRVCQRNFAK